MCFIVGGSLEASIEHLQACDRAFIEGPVPRNDATGKPRSLYLRDPDLNLIELSRLL